MNNKDYLNQIAAEARPLTRKAPGFFGNTLNLSMNQLKIIGIAIAAIFLVMVIAMIATSGNKHGERDYVDEAYLRTKDLPTIIDKYKSQLRSSELRSMTTSLKTVLTETNYNLSVALTNDFEVKSLDKTNKASTVTTEEALMGELDASLEAGRLNGVLDRVFAREFTYHISLLISIENNIISHTKKEPLKSNITTSKANLEILHEQFDNFIAN